MEITVLNKNEYCIINNPIDEKTGKNRMGAKVLYRGPSSFFLRPGEAISKIEKAYILNEDEALLVRAKEKFAEVGEKTDKKESLVREPGDKWMVYGPRNYIPPVEVEVVEPRNRIALD